MAETTQKQKPRGGGGGEGESPKDGVQKMAKKGVIKSSEFYQGVKAHDESDHIIFNRKTGALFYDADGTGSIAQIQIAILSKNLKLTYKDFFVV